MVSLNSRFSSQGIVLDTGLFIADERGRFDLRAFLARHSRLTPFMASITAAELYVGIGRAETEKRRREKQTVADQYFSTCAILSFDEHCAQVWASISENLRKRGLPIGPNDLLIAATALAHGYPVVTFNGGEFSRVPGLTTVALE